ncbi:MAG TPA: amidohydrolase family protein, partial [Planctomycetota bacterium]|nr:amidohydrolase family protein [Planctomycetota bacterium]
LAVRAAKVLTAAREGAQFVDRGVVLVRDGKIEAVGASSEVAVPEGYVELDAGRNWLMPGMVDLHCHVGGTFDINDMVYLANPGVRAHTAVIPDNDSLERAIASGVTSVLFIPGSGTNVGGQGVLFKTGHERYEQALIRNPGSLKIAQWGNPERWAIGVGKTFENYTIREILTRGRGYWERRRAARDGGAAVPVDVELEIFEKLFDQEAQVSVHTQIYQVVLETIVTIKGEFGLDVFIDHGTFDGWKAGALAQEMGVSAIVGPRNIAAPNAGITRWVGDNPERMQGMAAGYQSQGHKRIGFNTDSPVIPEEELQLQAGIAVRYGFDDSQLDTVRGLTIVPALTAGLGDRVGSIEVGKDADLVVISGHPADPRSAVERVLVDGHVRYDAREKRLW